MALRMDLFFHILVVVLTVVFIVGVIGCLLVIPNVAAKFLAVLFEHDPEPEPNGKNSPET